MNKKLFLTVGLILLTPLLYMYETDPSVVYGSKKYTGAIKSVDCNYRESKSRSYIVLGVADAKISYKAKGDLCEYAKSNVGGYVEAYFLRGYRLEVKINGEAVVEFKDRKFNLNIFIFMISTMPLLIILFKVAGGKHWLPKRQK